MPYNIKYLLDEKISVTYKKRKRALKTLGFKSYHSYLHSSLWQLVKKRLNRIKANKNCCICGSPRFAYHHKKYTYPVLKGKRSSLKWIYPVCKRCHAQIHAEEISEQQISKQIREMNEEYAQITASIA